ncbi:MAG: response regulator [Burkholderiales bacterium]|nr:response regulator [Burkholderiales bacterium]
MGADLRKQAEEIAQESSVRPPEELEPLSPEEMRQTLHELRVHQIELKMQNEELRQAQVELDAARARYFDLYDMAPVGYCSISESGLILEANLTAATLLGVARGALVGRPVSLFISKEDQDIYYLHRKQLHETGEQQVFDLRMVKNDATQFWAHLAASAAQEAGGASVLRVMLSDITERKRVEAERAKFDQVLRDKNAELERARIVAEKANLAKSEFLSSMSHELRTPLNAILGFAQLVESVSPQATPTQKRGIDQILKAGWYLLALINEILDLAVIDSGKLSLSMEPVSLAEVMRECESMVEPQAQKRGISVAFPQFEFPCFVKADRTRVKQVLINLLSNAIKYNKTGGTVAVECAPLNPPDSIRISVRDSGGGLTPEQLAQLFQPFNRLGKATSAEQGTGIGLMVAKRLVELMGGSIGVESAAGKGTVFWIDLHLTTKPQALVDAVETAAVTQEHVHGAAHSYTLLCVEDNPANLMLVEDLVARRPEIHLLSATRGKRGIEIARASLPDAILMDIDLPDISGIEALMILASDPATAHIPVIALSANAIPRDIEKGLEAGFFRYLTKPIKIDEFMNTLDVALKHAKAGAAGTANQKRT